MIVTFLGTGTSHGVPSLDCMIQDYRHCPQDVCRLSQEDPRHRRTRSSVLVSYEDKKILIDVTPDFREQALREQIRSIDAVLITHKHADHIGGIPDIRSYTRGHDTPLPMYGSEESMSYIRKSFSYAFDPNTFVGGGIPSISTNTITTSFDLCGKKVTPIPVVHGPLTGCYGYRIDNMAYIPDMKEMSPQSFALLQGLDTLIVNCLRKDREHATHMIIPQSVELARKIKPRKCYFIHMCHVIHYGIDSEQLDDWMSFAYDGLEICLD